MAEAISTAQADAVLAETRPDWGIETVSLSASAGRVLRATARADRPAPPGDRVCMDGIAVRFDDWHAGARRFQICGFQPAGSPPPTIALPANPACLEIATGSILKGPFDSVIPVERLSIADGHATVIDDYELSRGRNVHHAGSDHDTGAELLPAGCRITSARLAVLASIGMVEVPVSRRPRILLAATGDELIPPSGQPEAWQLRASNGPAIAAALTAAGFQVDLKHWPDDQEVLTDHVKNALDSHDVLIFSGGISAGKKDFLRPVCEGLGVDFQFLRVQQRPGKPFAYGCRDDRRLFCLPGNPVSALSCLHRYVLPELLAAEGRPQVTRQVTLASDFAFRPNLTYFLPVLLDGDQAIPCAPNGSGDWASPARGDGILEIPAELSLAPAGQLYRYFPFW